MLILVQCPDALLKLGNEDVLQLFMALHGRGGEQLRVSLSVRLGHSAEVGHA